MNYWDRVYKQSTRNFNKFKERINDFIYDDESLLDFGCGEGHFSQHIKPTIKYTGIDYSKVAIKKAKKNFPDKEFLDGDIRNLEIPDNSYDTVFLYECYENLPDWKQALKELWRIARKRIIIIKNGGFDGVTNVVSIEGDTYGNRIDFTDFNHEARTLTTSVAYNFDWNSHVIILLNKKMNNIIFTLDDFFETNNNLGLLEAIKEQSPGMKVTLFTEPAHCSYEWLKDLKEKYDWMEFAVHGWEHDVKDGPVECLHWTYDDTIKHLKMVEEKFPGIFVKIFKAPGWQINDEVYRALKDLDYGVMNQYIENPPEGKFYTTNHPWEVNGHIQNTPYNGLEELFHTKNVFLPESKYYFVSEVLNSPEILNHRLENINAAE